MGERVGTLPMCETAVDALEFAAQHNAAAVNRARRMLPPKIKLPRLSSVPLIRPDVLIKTHLAVAEAADALVRACVKCDLGLLKQEYTERPECPIVGRFQSMEHEALSEIRNLRMNP